MGMSKKKTKAERIEFITSELAAIQATIDHLLEKYVLPESELGGHLQHMGNRADAAAAERVIAHGAR